MEKRASAPFLCDRARQHCRESNAQCQQIGSGRRDQNFFLHFFCAQVLSQVGESKNVHQCVYMLCKIAHASLAPINARGPELDGFKTRRIHLLNNERAQRTPNIPGATLRRFSAAASVCALETRRRKALRQTQKNSCPNTHAGTVLYLAQCGTHF